MPDAVTAAAMPADIVVRALPEAGRTLLIPVPPGASVDLAGVDPAAAVLTRAGDDLTVALDGGGTIVLADFFAAQPGAPLPVLVLAGVPLAPEAVAAALEGVGAIEPAAGSSASGATAPPQGSGGDFDPPVIGPIGEGVGVAGLLGPTGLAFGIPEPDAGAVDDGDGALAGGGGGGGGGGDDGGGRDPGGFEDWQPGKNDGDLSEVRASLGIRFNPTDNEQIERLEIGGFPPGTSLVVDNPANPGGPPLVFDFIGRLGSVVFSPGTTPAFFPAGFPAAAGALTPRFLAGSISIRTPAFSDADIPLTLSARIVDPDTGAVFEVVGLSGTVPIDAVADRPVLTIDAATLRALEDGGAGAAGPLAVPLGISAAVGDADGSESLTAVRIVPGEGAEGLADPAGSTFGLLSSGGFAPVGPATAFTATLTDGTTAEVTPDSVSVGADGALTLTFPASAGIAAIDLSALALQFPQHSDDDVRLTVEVTSTETPTDIELDVGNNAATSSTDVLVEVDAVADAPDVPVRRATAAEDDRPVAGSAALSAYALAFTIALVDTDGSEALTRVRLGVDASGLDGPGGDPVFAAGSTIVTTSPQAVVLPGGGTDEDGRPVAVDARIFLDGEGGLVIEVLDGDIRGLDLSPIDVRLPADTNGTLAFSAAITAAEVDAEGAVAVGEAVTVVDLALDIARSDDPPTGVGAGGATEVLREVDSFDPGVLSPLPELVEGQAITAPDLGGLVAGANNLLIDFTTTAVVTFTAESAGFQSSLGAYTVDADGRISNVDLLFGDTSAGPLTPGVSEATYAMEGPGRLGFFLIADGFDALAEAGAVDGAGRIVPGAGELVFVAQGYDFASDGDPRAEGNRFDIGEDGGRPVLVFATLSGGAVTGVVTFAEAVLHSINQGAFNPDGQPHAIAGSLDGEGALGLAFEDNVQASDRDFNDAQFTVEVTPQERFVFVPAPLFAADPPLTLGDVDGDRLASLTVTVGRAAEGEVLDFSGGFSTAAGNLLLGGADTGIDVVRSLSGGTLTLALSGAADIGVYEAAVRSLTLDSTVDPLGSVGDKPVTVSFVDEGGLAGEPLTTVFTVSPPPEAPAGEAIGLEPPDGADVGAMLAALGDADGPAEPPGHADRHEGGYAGGPDGGHDDASAAVAALSP